MSKKSTKSIPEIGTQEFAEDVQKAFQDIYTILAEKYTKGDISELAEYVAYASIVVTPKKTIQGTHLEASLEAILGSVHGKGINLIKIAGVIVQEIATGRSEEMGFSFEKSQSLVLAKIHEVSSALFSESEIKGLSIGSSEVENFKELLKKDGLKAIQSFLKNTEDKKEE